MTRRARSGFWKALREVYGTAREQGSNIYVRWAHKTTHVLNKLPKGISATRQAAPTGHLDGRDQGGGGEGVCIAGLPKSDPDRPDMQSLSDRLWRRQGQHERTACVNLIDGGNEVGGDARFIT